MAQGKASINKLIVGNAKTRVSIVVTAGYSQEGIKGIVCKATLTEFGLSEMKAV